MFRLRPIWAAVAIAALWLLPTACNDDSTPGADGGTGTSADSACTGSGVVATGVVKAFEAGVPRQDFDFLSGVSVCVHGRDDIPCGETAGGVFSLCDLPENAQLLLRFEHPDYLPMLRMLETGRADYDILAETVLGASDLAEEQASEFGVAVDSISGGAIQFFGASPGDGVLQVRLLEGYSVSLLTLDGEPAQCPDGEGGSVQCLPLYLDPDGEADFDLSASTSIGIGAFGNVPPGQYLMRMSHPQLYCDQILPESGFLPAEAGETVKVEVLDGFITAQVGLFCQRATE